MTLFSLSKTESDDDLSIESKSRSDVLSLWKHSDKTLFWTGVIMLVLAPISMALVFLDPRILDGSLIWLKPLKFKISVGLFLITLAFTMSLTLESFRKSWLGRGVVWLAMSTSLFEIIWISFQAMMGERSHYNDSSAFGAGMYAVMGIAAVLLSLTPIMLCIASFWNRSKSSAFIILRWSVALGVIVTLIGAVWVGQMLGAEPAHYPDPTDISDEKIIPLVGWSMTAGDLRIAHFVGLHAYQGLFLAGLLLSQSSLLIARIILSCVALLWGFLVYFLVQLAWHDVSPFIFFT